MSSVIRAESFHAPGPADFDLPGFFSIGGTEITKPMIQLVLAAIIVFAFFALAIRRGTLVPGCALCSGGTPLTLLATRTHIAGQGTEGRR